jgi:hypothetical protein
MDLSGIFMLAGSAVEVYLAASEEGGMWKIEHVSHKAKSWLICMYRNDLWVIQPKG